MTFTLVFLAAAQLVGLYLVMGPATSPSRRLLAIAFVIAIPVGGLLLAWLVGRTKGMGVDPGKEARAEARRRPRATDVRRVGDLPPMLDRLMSSDQGERMAAFVALSTVGDANATALLHWVLEHGTPETALEAALTLEELDLRREAQALMATVPVVSSAREAAAFERRPVKRRTTMTALRPNQSSVA